MRSLRQADCGEGGDKDRLGSTPMPWLHKRTSHQMRMRTLSFFRRSRHKLQILPAMKHETCCFCQRLKRYLTAKRTTVSCYGQEMVNLTLSESRYGRRLTRQKTWSRSYDCYVFVSGLKCILPMKFPKKKLKQRDRP